MRGAMPAMSLPAVAMVPSTVKTWAPASKRLGDRGLGRGARDHHRHGQAGARAVHRRGPAGIARRGNHQALDPEPARLGHGHAEPARLEGARRILALVLGPEMREAEMRGEAGQRQERRAALAEEDGLFAGIERHELAEAVHAGLPLPEGVPGDGGGDAGQVVAHGEHLAALLAHGEELPRLVAVAADRALDVA